MKVIIDRFERNMAVCEKPDRTMIDIKREDMPKNAKEGDVIIINGSAIIIDVKETERRKKKIDELTKDIWN